MKTKILLILTLIIFYSCNNKMSELMNSTEATETNLTNETKDVKYIGMVHISTKEFYKDVAKKITEAKKNGYVLFYEYIDFEKANEEELRKIRKIVGMIPSPENYKNELKNLNNPNLMAQDNSMFFNLVNNKDFNVDFTPTQLLQDYENSFGKIELTQYDLDTPLDQTITQGVLPSWQFNEVVLKHRSKYLAQEIDKSKYKKIIVIYGASHLDSLLNELKKLDSNWKKI